ncbi:hypothetical protein B0F90DRAFT_1665042 [Multifurca ochricompacta]|uniref:Pentatricopeptide repeat-containing protein n=1 Tax=Multifurca ochricompacta TaxID=376703 RepID=A0AAD4MDQ7_9AGAM|nr:hypothetical protein B0F90DRAFT_1665042 [Multifurca ochricompacta]
MPVFGHAVTADTHRTVIRALADRGNTTALLKWLTTMSTKPGNIQPTLEFWHMFMDHCLVHSNIQTMSRGTHVMRSQGRPPNNMTYKFLVRKVFMSSSHHFLWIIRIINHISRANIPFDDTLLGIMLEGFNGLGLPSHAARVEGVYRSILLNHRQSSRGRRGHDFNMQLAQAFRANGQVAAMDLLQSLRGRGFQPSQATLISLLTDARKAEDIAFWERSFDIRAGSRVWSKVIRNALLSRSPAAVLEIYRAAKAAGVSVDLALAEPVIRSLCSSSLHSPTEAALDLAVRIYQEIEEAPSPEAKLPNIGSHIALFRTLLRALSISVNKAKYMPIAIDLLEEMKGRGLSDSEHTTSLVILLMRSASSFAEAFAAYKTVRVRTQVPFQAKGYAAILHTFTSLKFDNHYFQIVKDMQEDGSPVLPHLYTNMLRQMARMAARTKPSDPDYIHSLQKIVHTAREIQHLLSISTIATLDTPFWNQLMDTYQRAGAFEDARRIWDKLFHEGRADAASVSIIFDACGYARAGRTAVQVFADLRASGYKLNLRNWHAWLECLCRLGQLDDAARCLCLQMGNGPHGVPPDEEGVRILLKFANHRSVGDEVRVRIQRFLPALWETLPPDIVQGPY